VGAIIAVVPVPVSISATVYVFVLFFAVLRALRVLDEFWTTVNESLNDSGDVVANLSISWVVKRLPLHVFCSSFADFVPHMLRAIWRSSLVLSAYERVSFWPSFLFAPQIGAGFLSSWPHWCQKLDALALDPPCVYS